MPVPTTWMSSRLGLSGLSRHRPSHCQPSPLERTREELDIHSFKLDSLVHQNRYVLQNSIDFSNNFYMFVFKLHSRFPRVLTYWAAWPSLAMNSMCRVITIAKIVLFLFGTFCHQFGYDSKNIIKPIIKTRWVISGSITKCCRLAGFDDWHLFYHSSEVWGQAARS